MRIAVVSDIHGNNSAFEAILEDLRSTKPDLVLHGGDLVDGGANPVDVLDRIRDLAWPGVLGNADEIYTRPESLAEFATQSSAPQNLWDCIAEMAAATHEKLGEDRISWLRTFPRIQVHDFMACVHASPKDLWRSPGQNASDSDLGTTYAPLERDIVVFGHIHRPFVRRVASGSRKFTVANAGSVGLSYDGDSRASYLLLDDGSATIRRVEYDVEKEIRQLSTSGLPHADWIVKMLRSSSPQLP